MIKDIESTQKLISYDYLYWEYVYTTQTRLDFEIFF